MKAQKNNGQKPEEACKREAVLPAERNEELQQHADPGARQVLFVKALICRNFVQSRWGRKQSFLSSTPLPSQQFVCGNSRERNGVGKSQPWK